MKKLLIATILVFVPLLVHAEARFDATATASGSAIHAATTTSFTLAANATAIVVSADIGNTVPSLSSVTCGPGINTQTLLTPIGSINQSTTRRAEQWYINIDQNGTLKGSITCSAVFASGITADMVIGAVSVTGSDPRSLTVGHGTHATNGGASGTATVTVTGATKDLFVSNCGCGDSPTASGATQTTRWNDATPSTISGIGSTAPGAASLAMTVTMSSASWAIDGVAVRGYPTSGEFMSMAQ